MSDTLNHIVDRTEKILMRWVEKHELYENTEGKEGKEMTEVQIKIIFQRAKECGVQTPDIPGSALEKLKSEMPDLHLSDEMPPVSLEEDAATA